ncbi:MAG: hypothetical protein V7606_564 [Burkholderiales bacterium]|jgi:hypothetical protein
MEENEQDRVNRARRDFLRLTGNAGAIGAVAVLMGHSATVEAAAVVPEAEPPTTGYRETEHIRRYYYCASYW